MTFRKTALLLLISAAVPAFAQQPSQMDKELEALRAYCKPDIERLCPNVPPGGGRIKECLMQHKDGVVGRLRQGPGGIEEEIATPHRDRRA